MPCFAGLAFVSLRFFLFCMYGYFTYACTYACSAHEGQKGAPDLLELELHRVLSGSGHWEASSRISARAADVVN